MKKVAWVTDTTAFIDEQLEKNKDLFVIPMTVFIDGNEYKDGEDGFNDQVLFKMLKEAKEPPKTSQPSVGAFLELYRSLGEDYDAIISIHVSAKLSGTYSSSIQAAQLTKTPVYHVDSKILSYPISHLIKHGMSLLDKGVEIEDVIHELEHIRDKNETYVIIGNLEQLHRSGRMNGLQFFLGSMLNVQPIVSIADGVLVAKGKVRSESKAKDKILHLFEAAFREQKIDEAWILYGLNDQKAAEWQAELTIQYPSVRFSRYPIGAVVGVHAGEDTIGLSWNKE